MFEGFKEVPYMTPCFFNEEFWCLLLALTIFLDPKSLLEEFRKNLKKSSSKTHYPFPNLLDTPQKYLGSIHTVKNIFLFLFHFPFPPLAQLLALRWLDAAPRGAARQVGGPPHLAGAPGRAGDHGPQASERLER